MNFTHDTFTQLTTTEQFEVLHNMGRGRVQANQYGKHSWTVSVQGTDRVNVSGTSLIDCLWDAYQILRIES